MQGGARGIRARLRVKEPAVPYLKDPSFYLLTLLIVSTKIDCVSPDGAAVKGT